MARQAFRR